MYSILHTGYQFVHDSTNCMGTFTYVMITVISLCGREMLCCHYAGPMTHPGDNMTNSLIISNWSTGRFSAVVGAGPRLDNCRQLVALIVMERQLLCLLNDSVTVITDFRCITRQLDQFS